MAEEPSPEIDPLESLKEANRRRGGIGTFLLGLIAFILFLIPGMVLLGYLGKAVKPDAKLDTEILFASFVIAIAGALQVTKVFTRMRVRRLEEEAKRKASQPPPGPASP
jgi:hypothetical protein